MINIKCVYNPLAQLFTILLLTEDAGPYSFVNILMRSLVKLRFFYLSVFFLDINIVYSDHISDRGSILSDDLEGYLVIALGKLQSSEVGRS